MFALESVIIISLSLIWVNTLQITQVSLRPPSKSDIDKNFIFL